MSCLIYPSKTQHGNTRRNYFIFPLSLKNIVLVFCCSEEKRRHVDDRWINDQPWEMRGQKRNDKLNKAGEPRDVRSILDRVCGWISDSHRGIDGLTRNSYTHAVILTAAGLNLDCLRAQSGLSETSETRCSCVWSVFVCEPCVRLQYGTFLKPRGRVGLDAQIKQCVFACKCVCGVVGQCRTVPGFRVKGLVSVTVIEATVYKQRACQCVCRCVRFDLSTVQNSELPF